MWIYVLVGCWFELVERPRKALMYCRLLRSELRLMLSLSGSLDLARVTHLCLIADSCWAQDSHGEIQREIGYVFEAFTFNHHHQQFDCIAMPDILDRRHQLREREVVDTVDVTRSKGHRGNP